MREIRYIIMGFLVISSLSTTILAEKKRTFILDSSTSCNNHHDAITFSSPCYQPENPLFESILKDILKLNVNLFSVDSLKILGVTIPLYLQVRCLDDKIHHCFYDEKHHKNKCQLPRSCSTFAAKSLSVPIVLFGSRAFLSHDEERQATGYVFLLGMPFVIIGKDIIKNWQGECAKRPKCEWFCRHKTAYGGFPSGHAAEALYITVLFAMRYGARYAVPLSAYSAYLIGSFINCNRHYASQIVAGGALGAMYAFAANRLIDSKFVKEKAIDVNMGIDVAGSPTLSLGFQF